VDSSSPEELDDPRSLCVEDSESWRLERRLAPDGLIAVVFTDSKGGGSSFKDLTWCFFSSSIFDIIVVSVETPFESSLDFEAASFEASSFDAAS
jgi:hypothetical protein